MATKVPTSFNGTFVKRPKVLITHKLYRPAAIQILAKHCDVITPESIPPTREEILALCPNVDAIIWTIFGLPGDKKNLNAEVLDAAGPSLKVVSTSSTGYDHVDVVEIRRRNILFGHASGETMASSVADIAVGLMISAGRRFHEGRLHIDSSQWISHPEWLVGRDIEGSTMGIVGFGCIGQAIAKRLRGFEIGKLLYTGHSVKPEAEKFKAHFVSFNELIAESDYVIIAAPLTQETHHLFGQTTFTMMKPTSVLVNVARGQIVNTNDLVTALKSGQIFAAGIDVMDPEPLPAEHELLTLPNIVLSPHLGTATHGTRDDIAIFAAYNVLLALSGQPMLAPVV